MHTVSETEVIPLLDLHAAFYTLQYDRKCEAYHVSTEFQREMPAKQDNKGGGKWVMHRITPWP